MAVNFPGSPTNGQVHTSGGISWIYDSALGAWKIVPNTITGPQGLQGIQGIQGVSVQGSSGTSQGIQGIQGAQGRQGIQGIQGTSIASLINATAVTTDTKLYPVLVYNPGSSQTAQTITSFAFNSTFSTFTIGSNTSQVSLITLNGFSPFSLRGIQVKTLETSRWYMGTDIATEAGGSNTGSNLMIANYANDGSAIGTVRPLSIYRSNGVVAIANLTSISTLTSTGPATFNSTGQFYGRLYGYSDQTVAAGTMLNATGSLGGIEVQGPNSANSAFMCFHKPGNYASYFGIDTDNQFAVGGWSAGAALANMKVGSLGVGTAATTTAGQVQATNYAISADVNNRFVQGAFYLRSGAPTIYFRDTDHNSGMIHCNSNLLYVLRGATDSESFTQVNSQWPFYFNLSNNEALCGSNFYAVGNITAYYSDKRLKKDIKSITGALEKVNQISGITYKNNELAKGFGFDNDAEQVGVISQEIEKVLPQVVVPAPFDIETDAVLGTTKSKSGENYKTVQYDRIVPLLIEAIKELGGQVDDMKHQIKELKEKMILKEK
jgi:hypothetical protein